MTFSQRGAMRAVAIALLVTMATQIFYIAVVSPTDDALLRKVTWTVEMAMFSLVFVAGLPLAGRNKMPLVWSAIALAGVVNVIQVGMGLAEFGPAEKAEDAKVFEAILSGAFFLYFHGKAMLGLAAIGIGLETFGHSRAGTRALSILCLVCGAVAAVLNLLGMANGMEWVFAAGAAGTLATALLAIAILLRAAAEQDFRLISDGQPDALK